MESNIRSIIEVLDKLCKQCDQDAVLEALKQYLTLHAHSGGLVVIPCSGSHPEDQLRNLGEVFHASEGVLNIGDAASASQEFSRALIRVKEKLSEKAWDKIYLATHGPAVLTAQIKLLVYRILHVETIDLLYVNNSYLPIAINQTHLIRGG
jgi:hypothetical protein